MKKRFSSVRLIFLLLLLMALFGAAASLWVSRTDLRSYLQAELSRALGRGVTMSAVRLQFLPTPALDLRDLTIAGSGDAFETLQIPHLHLKPALLPLFKGQLVFTEVILQSPSLKIDLALFDKGTRSTPSPPLKSPSAGRLRLETLRLREGHVTLFHSTDSRFPSPLVFPNLNGRLNLKPGAPQVLMLDGGMVLEESAIPFSGELAWTPDETPSWRQKTVTARFSVQ